MLRSCAIAQLGNMDVNNEERADSKENSRSLSTPLIGLRNLQRGKSAVDLLGPLASRRERNPFVCFVVGKLTMIRQQSAEHANKQGRLRFV